MWILFYCSSELKWWREEVKIIFNRARAMFQSKLLTFTHHRCIYKWVPDIVLKPGQNVSDLSMSNGRIN